VIWLIDTSGSMAQDGKIQALNNAVREALPHLREAARENPHANVLVRVVAFADEARWQTVEPTPVERFTWNDFLQPGGVTNLGAALALVAADFATLQERGLPPVLVLITDCQATDDVDAGLRALGSTPWGARAVRIGIGLGRDADHDLLRRFMGDPDQTPLSASNPEQLTAAIRWASTVAVGQASTPRLSPTPVIVSSRPEPAITDIW
jgi:uncharacterized protein YegL